MHFIVPFSIGLVFLGCTTNVVFLELIVKDDPGAGNLVTLCQFLFIACEGLFFVTNFMTKKPIVPLRKYMELVTFYFTVSVVNNYAINFNIPMPLHMIFRAGSLMANMVLGIIILKKEYPSSKYVAVVMITVGIAIATIASAQLMSSHFSGTESTPSDDKEDQSSDAMELIRLCIGIAMLLFALFMSARMGIFQEVLYREHGKHPREAMFYTHALPLPGFLLLAPHIWNKIVYFSASEPITLGFITLPKLWAYILGNCLTHCPISLDIGLVSLVFGSSFGLTQILRRLIQYVCIRGVFALTTECPSLVVTLVITLRKFVSLLFSILYFGNPFTVQHWIGTVLVFSGTALFSGVLHSLAQWLGLMEKPKQE